MTASSGPVMWMECFAGDARIEGGDADAVADLFVAHANESHDWSLEEKSLRNYARNYTEANVRLTGPTDRLDEIGEVTVRPVTEDLIDDWIRFFDHDGFAGNPDWASCYCLEPHVPESEKEQERPWREVRDDMLDLLASGVAFGYLAYVDGRPAGWVNASLRSSYGLYASVDPEGPDPGSVIGVSCFLIAPPYRRHGLAATLLDGVIADAPERGAEWVEGYPYNEPEANDPGHFRGPRHIYEERGFEPIEERAKDTVMRLPAG
ncbi:MAG TPA: GNAT family N-acetyltransferase [Acidimicrobiia bacterium]|nr:GNAT family N-acetyltransferase [Acidimicrobiia bacterium]